MSSLKEFLSNQEGRLQEEKVAWIRSMERWGRSVLDLFDQIQKWIKESDPHGLIVMDHGIDLPPSGSTEVRPGSKLIIRLGDREATLRPVSNKVLGPRWKPGGGSWAGRVDLLGDPYDHEVYLFRHDDDREEWYLRSTRDYQVRLLDRASFDAALVEMLS